MVESGEVKLVDIGFSGESSSPIDSMPGGRRNAAKVRFAKGFIAAAATSESGRKTRTPVSLLPVGQIVDQSCYMQSHYAPDIKAPTGRGGRTTHDRTLRSTCWGSRSGVVAPYFKSAGVEVLPWPGSPPDLNPLDYGFWACLEDDIRRKLLRNLDDVKECLLGAHNEFDRQKINNVIDAFPGRLRRCVELGGEELGASEGISGSGAGDS